MWHIRRKTTTVRPSSLRRQIFDCLQSLLHPSTKGTAKLVSQRFVWPGIQKDCRTWALACQPCQQSKVFRHTVNPMGNITLPAGRFLHIHVDYTGPWTTSAGFSYCRTVIDRFTHWLEVTPSRISPHTPQHAPRCTDGYPILIVLKPPQTKSDNLRLNFSTPLRNSAACISPTTTYNVYTGRWGQTSCATQTSSGRRHYL